MDVVIAIVGSRIEADMMVGMLTAHGVRARVSADDVGGVDLALQAQGVRVLVPSDDQEDAQALLDDL